MESAPLNFVQKRRIDIAHGNGGQYAIRGIERFGEGSVGGSSFHENLILRQGQSVTLKSPRDTAGTPHGKDTRPRCERP